MGPQPFKKGQGNLFFGRKREIADIIGLLASRRALMLHADSGAGKTSLLNAGLVSEAPPEQLLILPPARVRGRPPEAASSDGPFEHSAEDVNIYIRNLIEDLHAQVCEVFKEHRESLEGLPYCRTLTDYASAIESILLGDNDRRTVVYIVDQFEELFTTNLNAWKDRRGFFEQVRALLNPPLSDDEIPVRPKNQRRLLLSMRSDYVAQVERFSHLLPERLNARYHLQRLKQNQAVRAIACPAELADLPFDKGAAEALARRLSKERIMLADGTTETIEGEFVEPVQLQVICERLWRSLPPDAKQITNELAEKHGNVEQALTEYYELAVADAARATSVTARQIRRWFDTKLLTAGGFRSQAFVDIANNTVDGLPLDTVERLQSEYHIVRSENRGGARWIEISHDRFVEPIRKSNDDFNDARRQKLNHRVLAASLTALVILTAGFVWYQTEEQKRGASEERFSAAVIAALGNDSLRHRTLSALDALEIREDAQSLGAAYTVLADLRQVRRIFPPPSGTVVPRSALAIDPQRRLLLGEWQDGMWRVRVVGDSRQSDTGPAALNDRPLPSEPLAWSRDGTQLAGVTTGGEVWIAAAGKDTPPVLDYGGGPLVNMAFDNSGRYLAAIHCRQTRRPECQEATELIVWETGTGDRVATINPPETRDLRRIAISWPEGSPEPWLAVVACLPRHSAAQSAAGRNVETSAPASSAEPSQSVQQTAASPGEGAQRVCSETVLLARIPGPPDGTGEAAAPSNGGNVDDKAPPEVSPWQEVDRRGQVGKIAFAAAGAEEASGLPTLLFVERDRDTTTSTIRSVHPGSEFSGRRFEYPFGVLGTSSNVGAFIELDGRRVAWIDNEDGVVVADTGAGAPLSTLVAGADDLADLDSSGSFDGGFASRPAFLADSGEFLYKRRQVFSLLDRRGISTPLYTAQGSRDPLANIVIGGNQRYALSYGLGGMGREQDRTLIELRTNRTLASNVGDVDAHDQSPWSEVFGSMAPSAFAYIPGGNRLLSIDVDGVLTTWNADTAEVIHSGVIASREHSEISEFYDFYALRSEPLAVLAGEQGTFVINTESYLAKRLGTPISVTIEPYANESRLAVGTEFGIAIWDTRQIIFSLREAGAPTPDPVVNAEPTSDIVVDIAVDEARRLLFGATYSGGIQLWNLDSGRKIGKPIMTGYGDLIGMAYDPVGGHLLTSHITGRSEIVLVDVSGAGLQGALCRVVAGAPLAAADEALTCPPAP